MSSSPAEANMSSQCHSRPKRHRRDSQRTGQRLDPGDKSLELDGVLRILGTYTDEQYRGGVNCCVCGKLYRSRVCLIKHLWEHSVYWDMFDCEKNQDRVLSIQAALILYCHHGTAQVGLPSLLVTSPNEKKREPPAGAERGKKPPAVKRKILGEISVPDAPPCKRRRCISDSGVSSGSDSETPTK